MSRAHSEPLAQEQDVERPFLVGVAPPPRPLLVSDQAWRQAGFLRLVLGEGVRVPGAHPVAAPPSPGVTVSPLPCRLAQLDIDSHLAQCLAGSTEDMVW